LIEGLFSDRAATRGAAYDIVTDEFRRDPEVVPAVLSYAHQRLNNDDGAYNTVVTLEDLSRAVTQPRKGEINQFCDEAEKPGERIKKQTDALRKWLETKR
jgi:hypothetical protein